MLSFLLLLQLIHHVWSHGRLMEPPARSSMWRAGFQAPVNYNDNELFCGGIEKLWSQNHGNCGICGDPWDVPPPRPNEDGGLYGRGIIVRKYKMGQTFTATVQLTANHNGYFEFRICPVQYANQVVDQACLDQNLLQLADGSGTRYYVGPGTGDIHINLVLPEGLSCQRCVFQWHYRAGNNWGRCSDMTQGLGCGPQEYFRGCADIQIEP
ncbi:uncharacterized protein LOC111620074 [Centruroides sculpturatus]|uniref:uncharacterized protein LOC111620070 n=1 Tax=Centruroides sculpturatus TaxID=218467 RepID=UPI000C6CCB71|nr:uncharacterized protein LOC111620070 [Centruroides sculpturatus]XP_023217682.1 uncharacterized protein LOC111620070 [Centruroides sculpturatus]XP_023217687.1 uncharacterized protein LOC111620074 [Centruroides sculpturatus]XP_023217688.1 uncharacterized protein LOC111620074 [Centruroides sculpturatus]